MPAAPDPDLALRLAKALVDLYSAGTLTLLQAVVRRLARGIRWSPGWAEAKLIEVGRLRDEAQAVVDRLVEAGPERIRQAIEAAYEAGEDDAAADLADVELVAGPSLRGVDRLVTEAVSLVSSTHLGILRSVDDAYRQVIAEVAGQVTAGTTTRLDAARLALARFADRGITGYTDAAGRRWELEAYVETAVRTAVGRAQVAGALDRLQAGGRDLVIVSEHPQECVLCRPWEGKVLSITGATPGYPTVSMAVAAGLHHPNCRHALTAYIPGLTAIPVGTEDPEGDRARQQLRAMERQIRRWKRRAAAAIDDTDRRRANARVRAIQARLREHVEAHDLTRKRERERLGAR